MEVPLTRQLTSFCHRLRYDELSPEVVERTKYFFLDYLGVAVRGSLSDSSQPVYRMLGRLGVWGVGSVLGRADRAAFPYAALANGTSAHSLELDDTHQAGSIHLGVSVFSAALAVAEELGASGRDFIVSSVCGFEVAARLAMALRPKEHYGRGFHPTATCGALGAAVAAAKLLGVSERQMTCAVGIAGSQAGGLLEFLADGAWTKRLHPGWAAFSGVHAAILAREGFTGPASVIEGRDGFLKAFSARPEPGQITDGLGQQYEILHTAVKPHACCRYSQAPVDAVLTLAREHDLRPQDVERVTIGMLEAGIPVICEPPARKYRPQSVVDAQFSLPFAVAVALVRRRAGLEEFTDDTLRDATVTDLVGRVGYERDPGLETNYPREWPAWARITLKDGSERRAHVRFPKGDPENPLSWDELAGKYRSLAGAVWKREKVERVEESVRRLEEEDSLKAVAALF